MKSYYLKHPLWCYLKELEYEMSYQVVEILDYIFENSEIKIPLEKELIQLIKVYKNDVHNIDHAEILVKIMEEFNLVYTNNEIWKDFPEFHEQKLFNTTQLWHSLCNELQLNQDFFFYFEQKAVPGHFFDEWDHDPRPFEKLDDLNREALVSLLSIILKRSRHLFNKNRCGFCYKKISNHNLIERLVLILNEMNYVSFVKREKNGKIVRLSTCHEIFLIQGTTLSVSFSEACPKNEFDHIMCKMFKLYQDGVADEVMLHKNHDPSHKRALFDDLEPVILYKRN